ncbi:MAG: hypothetical protein RIT45_1880 [Pseudomonadota bacterium]
MKTEKRTFWSRLRRPSTPPAQNRPAQDQEPVVFWPRVANAVAASVALALLFAVATSYDVWSQRTRQFKVRGFEIHGQHRAWAAQVQHASGLRHGSPLFGVQEADLAAAVTELPWVARATVHIRMPGTVEIEVHEHEPAALLSDDGLWVIDARAQVVKPLDPGEKVDVPMLTGVALADLLPPLPGLYAALRTLPWVGAVGRRIEVECRTRRALTRSRAQAMLRLYERVQESDVAEIFEVGELAWDEVTGATLVRADDGAELRLGHIDDDDQARQLDRAARLLHTLKGRGERLRYALLDDTLRPERIIVVTAPANHDTQHGGPVGGPQAPKPPQARP